MGWDWGQNIETEKGETALLYDKDAEKRAKQDVYGCKQRSRFGIFVLHFLVLGAFQRRGTLFRFAIGVRTGK